MENNNGLASVVCSKGRHKETVMGARSANGSTIASDLRNDMPNVKEIAGRTSVSGRRALDGGVTDMFPDGHGVDQSHRAAKADNLSAALLASLSHDLKTPITSIVGAAETLRDFHGTMDESTKAELLSAILQESQRLNRFVVNLFNMTKLHGNAVVPSLAKHDPVEIVYATVKSAANLLVRHRVEVRTSPNLPMLELDPVLLEQALMNLLDNAAKYSAEGATVCIQVIRDQYSIFLLVLDEGKGIPNSDVEKVFERFYRSKRADREPPGTGLGLTISRAFIEAMDGSITATNRTDTRGAQFTIRFRAPHAPSHSGPNRGGGTDDSHAVGNN